MELRNTINLGERDRRYAVITGADVAISRSMQGYRLSFNFNVSSHKREENQTIDAIGCDMDLYFRRGSESVLLGRLTPAIGERPIVLNGYDTSIRREIDFPSEVFALLIDNTYKSDVTFEFDAAPVFVEGYRYPNVSRGVLTIPQSEWLKKLNGLELERFELIAIRIPIKDSHNKPPFEHAVEKVRQAERLYTQGNWNAAAAAVRAAWRTILSDGNETKRGFENLIGRVIGDPKRKEFGMQLVTALNQILNKGVHLEGDVKTQTPPGDLEAEDALLCLQLYTVIIGYISCVTETNGR